MKEQYEALEMEVIEFEAEDVILTSLNGDNNEGPHVPARGMWRM